MRVWVCFGARCAASEEPQLQPDGTPILPKDWRLIWFHLGVFAFCPKCNPPETESIFEEDFPDAP